MSGTRSGGFSVVISAEDRATKPIEAINRKLREMQAPAERLTLALGKLSETTGINKMREGFVSLAESSHRVFENFGRIVPQLGLITGAASIAGITELARKFGETGQNLGFVAARSNTSVEGLARWQGVAKLAGSSVEAMNSGMEELHDNMAKGVRGFAPEFMNAVRQMHLEGALTESDGDPAKFLPKLLKALHDIPEPAKQAARAQQTLGGAAAALFPVYQKTSAEIDEYIKKVDKAGPMTGEMTEHAKALKEADDALQLSVKGVGDALSDAVSGPMTDAEKWLGKWLDDNRELIKTDVKGWVDDYKSALAPLATSIDGVVKSTIGWNKALEFGVPALLLQMIGPVRSLEAALLRLGAITIPSWLIANPAAAAAGALVAAGGVAGRMEAPMTDDYGRVIGNFGGRDESSNPAFNNPLNAPTSGQALGDMMRFFGTMRFPRGWGGGSANVVPDPTADRSMEPEMRALLETISIPESAGSGGYAAKNPGSSAYGKYQIIDSTNKRATAGTGHPGMAPLDQDIKGRWLVEQAYRKYTFGRDIVADIKAGRTQDIVPALRGTWPSLPGGSQQLETQQQFDKRLHDQMVANSPTPPSANLFVGAQRNVGGGSGTAPSAPADQKTTVKGSADLRIKVDAAPGLTARTTATTSGDLFSGAPQISPAMSFP
jgi:muramidase (phage lysozyme)